MSRMVLVGVRAWFCCIVGFAVMPMTAFGQDARAVEVQQLYERIGQLERLLQGTPRELGIGPRITEIGSRPAAVVVEEPRQLVRVYDVRDLFVLAPYYGAQRENNLMTKTGPVFPLAQFALTPTSVGGGMGGGMGGGGMGAQPNVRDEAARQPVKKGAMLLQMGGGGGFGGQGSVAADDIRPSLNQLIDAIKESIDPSGWDDAGGPNSIATIGSALIISSPADVHNSIGDLLKLLRQRWGKVRTVTVKAHWLWLTDAQLGALLQRKAAGPDEEDPFVGALDAEEWKSALQRAAQGEGRGAGYRAAVACYSGQTVHVVSGDQSLAVTGIRPVIGKSRTAYEPATSVIQQGIALQVRPTATTSGKVVVIDLHSRVSRRGSTLSSAREEDGDSSRSADDTARSIVSTLDRPSVTTQRLATTLRVPVKRPVLVGGMSFDSNGTVASLYLVVEADVQEVAGTSEDSVPSSEDASPKN